MKCNSWIIVRPCLSGHRRRGEKKRGPGPVRHVAWRRSGAPLRFLPVL